MSSERPEFRPIETAPGRRVWPYAVLGAALVVALIYIGRRNATPPEQAVALGNVAPKAEPPKLEPLTAAAEKAKPAAPQGPNVLGTVANAAKTVVMVARAELDRELARTQSAQKQAAAYKKQIGDLEKQLADARGQIAAITKAKAPPPPSDQEQILQMLAPVLRSSNDGRP
jgi:type IV secretory pathway VirB10-like protein